MTELNDITFLGSFPTIDDCPPPSWPEYAFCGRSNVGKSSLINMLTNRKNLARTSNTPGKTQQLNYFLIDNKWVLVDLPGYGYARVSQKMRNKWKHHIREYLELRPTLACVFALVDAMLPPQAPDIEFINFMGVNEIPFVIVFTKSDRSKDSLSENINQFLTELGNTWATLPKYFITSATKHEGREEILSFIQSVNESIDS